MLSEEPEPCHVRLERYEGADLLGTVSVTDHELHAGESWASSPGDGATT